MRRIAVTWGVAVAITAAAGVADAAAQGDRETDCAALRAGDGGAPFSGSVREPADQGAAPVDEGNMSGGGAGTAPTDGAGLPERVRLRTSTESLNRRYWFATRDGHIYLKSNADRTGIRQPWRRLVLPDCLEGHVREISSDGVNLVAIDADRRLFTATGAHLAPARFAWTARWGPYLWAGLGYQLPPDVTAWAVSDLNPAEDGSWRDRVGRDNEIAGITTLYQLRGDGTTITYNDPWLPNDESYEVCGPQRGRFRAAGLSASGSTVILVGRHGELWTRLYEFDISGANTVLLDYSYEDPDLPRLPAPDWVRHPPVPGRPTQVVSIAKHHKGSVNRILRVEAVDRRKRRGYYRKDLNEGASARWVFVPTGRPLRGRLLPRPPRGKRSGPLAPALALRYVRDAAAGWSAEIPDFHPVCSPARLLVRIDGGGTLELVLHAVDGLRQQPRGKRLEGGPREYLAAIEVPAELWQRRAELPAAARTFLDQRLGGRRFAHTPLVVSPSGMRFTDLCWTLRAAAAPPGTPAPSMPAVQDPGDMLGRMTAAQEGRRREPPPSC